MDDAFGGNVVLKKVDDEQEARVIADVMSSVVVDPSKVRIARPVPSTRGGWVADGWTACEYVAGVHVDAGPQPWSLALEAIDALNDA